MPNTRKWPWYLLTPLLLLVGLGVLTYVIDADLISFFLPVRWIALTGSLLGAIAIGLTIGATHRRILSRSGLAAGLLLAFAVFVFVREFTQYREVDLSYQNQETTLAGTLYLPKGEGPFPAVVIAQGSIRAPRTLYHFWADHLVRRGIAVLSFDKRGTGKSGGTYEEDNNASEENLSRLASDIALGVEALQARSEISASRIGIFGLSMGGWLAPIAAERSSSVAFMALNSGPTVSVGEENTYSDLTGDTPRDRTPTEQARIDSSVAHVAPSGYDPRPALRRLDIPAFWQFAGHDSSIPTAKSVVVLDSLIASGKPYTYHVYPDADHLGFESRWPADLPEGFIDDLADWILAQ